MKRAAAFTLIELMVASALAMFLAGACVSAFLSVRQFVRRAESRIAMYDNAQVVYAKLAQSTGQLMQHCALVVDSTAGSVELTFMRGKEDQWDWKLSQRTKINSDLVWERWRWQKNGTGGTLYLTSSQPLRTFTGTQGQAFDALPQPRRFLDPANPRSTLEDNRYFPTTGIGGSGDIGDNTDLENGMLPVLAQVSDLAIELVNQDGTVDTITAASPRSTSASPNPLVRQGVWMDGRVGDALAVTPSTADYATSAIAKRPKLLRLRFTTTDQATDARSALSQTFSFSFALPGLATVQ